MEQALKGQTKLAGAVRVFQTVKRYQRRRAASHNPKRLPKAMRKRALDQVNQLLIQMARDPESAKKMGRKKKRSPARLLSFKTKEGIWLETHLWHAKRMKMVGRWGLKLALHPTQKCRRSMYRASKHEATLYDASWKKVVELKGDVGTIGLILGRLCDPLYPAVIAEQYFLLLI